MRKVAGTRGATSRRHATRAAAAMMLVGAGLIAITVALPPAAQGSDLVILGLGALVAATGVVLLRVREAPEFALGLAAALGTAVITVCTWQAGLTGNGAEDNEILYIWVCLYSFYFLSLPQALAQLGFVIVAYGALLVDQAPSDTIGTRLMVMGTTLLVAGLIVARLRQSLEVTLRELSRRARRDPLTGTLNRRGLEERAAVEVARMRRHNAPLSLIVMDVDGLKALNDGSGHPVGDDVLRIVGRVLDGQTRDIDAAARLGGDEFAVLVPGVSADEARSVADRLRLTARRELTREGLDVSLSVGVATREPPRFPSLEVLTAAADTALYEAKRLGGDQVRSASDRREALAV